MPSSTTSVKLCAAHPGREGLVVGRWPSRSSALSSQPSHLASSVPVQSDASRAHSRRIVAAGAPLLGGVSPIDLASAAADRDGLARRCRGRARVAALVRHRAEQLVGGVGEQLHAIGRAASSVIASSEMPARLEVGQHAARASSTSSSRLSRELAVIAERVERRGRHRVDGVRADQLLDIEHVAVGLVLGAGARPQQPLRLGALRAPALPTRAARTAACSADRRAWRWRSRPCPAARRAAPSRPGRWPRRSCSSSTLSTARVDPADEEARDARHLREVAARSRQALRGPSR